MRGLVAKNCVDWMKKYAPKEATGMTFGESGPYWKQGMQNGYQDVGSWTFFKDHDANKPAGAWLYAQFVTAKSTSLKKTIVGLTPIRESDIQSQAWPTARPSSTRSATPTSI